MKPFALTAQERYSWGWPVSTLVAGSRLLWDPVRNRPIDMCCQVVNPRETEVVTVIGLKHEGPVYRIDVAGGRMLEVARDAVITLIETV